jgi:hypothetical protein
MQTFTECLIFLIENILFKHILPIVQDAVFLVMLWLGYLMFFAGIEVIVNTTYIFIMIMYFAVVAFMYLEFNKYYGPFFKFINMIKK